MRSISASLVNMYHVCERELWLHANGINMEFNSDIVKAGKLIEISSYERRSEKKEQIDIYYDYSEQIKLTAKIDFFNHMTNTIHETKKSNKLEHAHKAQVRFYQFLLEKMGFEQPKGLLEYPVMRTMHHMDALTSRDVEEVKAWITAIVEIIGSDECPVVVRKKYCKSCSYFDFCYSE